ncbi:low copy number virion structural protein [Campylobacter jejuni]|nr:low copy number virion structural protein [Campylobacter jejuni]
MAYTINHEDIWIESGQPLSWTQRYDEYLNYDNLNINSVEYMDYRPTQLQFHLTSADVRQSIAVKIKYANRLTRTHAKHAVICQYDVVEKQWVILPHKLNTADRTLEFTTDEIGSFCVFINHYWYTELTQRMADEYPNWTKIRQSKASTGQLFLNYFGMELETVKDYLEWIREQKYIGTADLQALDWVKMYQLPEVKPTDEIKLLQPFDSGGTVIYTEMTVLESLKEFFYNEYNQGGIIDYQDMRLYCTKSYSDLKITITRDGETTEHMITPLDYHIWNSFDEFGMILGVKRLHLEQNEEFKERILDVFRYPSGTHDIGLTNGIARELAMIQRTDRLGKRLVWEDDRKDFYLKNTTGKVIDIRTLRVDNQQLKASQYKVDAVGGIRIYALNELKRHELSFIYGIEKYQLYDKSNEALHRMMYEDDGQATPTLLNWVEYINMVAPVMWDRFRWDEGFWDTIDKQLTGLGYVPNIWDSNIEVWKDYVFDSER